MHKPESVLEYETHKFFKNFDIQTDQRILARRLDLVIVNIKKGTCQIKDFTVSENQRAKIQENN